MVLSLYNLFFFLISTFHLYDYSFAQSDCNPHVPCNETGPVVRFPFWRKERQSDRCGSPGYELSCNNKSETIINLPRSGQFIVKNIDYYNNVILITDPDSCLAKRMHNVTLSGSRFRGDPSRRYSFFNCSSNWTYTGVALYQPVPMVCVSSRNYTVYGLPSSIAYRIMASEPCIAMDIDDSVTPEGDLELMWDDPRCPRCTSRGLICQINEEDNTVRCLYPRQAPERNGGLPRSAKYGIIIGVGIPAFLFIIGLASHICNRIRGVNHQNRQNTELSATLAPQIVITVTGLDGRTIESYPKTLLGESRRLPKLSDGTCPICLCEYQPKECLRTIPECNHYFHVDCIDEWLKLNGTCPLCRNSLESLSTTPCSSVSSSSTATSISS